MSTELSKAERTRQFIVEAAAAVFNTKGYEGTSLADLTKATGLTKGSIYGNFQNKEEVALACFDYNSSRLSGTIQQRQLQETTYHGKLMVYAHVYHSYSDAVFPKGGCPILNTATEADDNNEPLKKKVAQAILRWKKRVHDLITEGMANGEFKAGTNADQIALSIIALIEGGIMISKATDNRSNLDSVLKTVEMLITQMKK